jgi:hypothetical protein
MEHGRSAQRRHRDDWARRPGWFICDPLLAGERGGLFSGSRRRKVLHPVDEMPGRETLLVLRAGQPVASVESRDVPCRQTRKRRSRRGADSEAAAVCH